MKTWLKPIWPWMRNEYAITMLLFLVWIIFFSQNNLVDRFRIISDINQLEADKEYYKKQINRDSTRLYELTTNKENLEKFAREQYYMKKDDEDLFVIIEEEE